MKTFPKRVLLSFALLVAVGASLASITTIDLATMVRNKLGLANGGTNADLSGTGGANAFLAQAADHSISARHPAYTDITGLSTVAHTGAWSDLQDATGNLTLANGANATTFNQTSAVNWTWANTTAATATAAGAPSPILNLSGTYFTLEASAVDNWSIQNVLNTPHLSSTVTNITETAGSVVTLTITGGNFAVGDVVTFTGLTKATWLNGQNATLITASATSLTFNDPVAGHNPTTTGAETGQVTQANPVSMLSLSHAGSGANAVNITASLSNGAALIFGGSTTNGIGVVSNALSLFSQTSRFNFSSGTPQLNLGLNMGAKGFAFIPVDADTSMGILGRHTAVVSTAAVVLGNNNALAALSGTQDLVRIGAYGVGSLSSNATFSPAYGTGTFNTLNIAPTINQAALTGTIAGVQVVTNVVTLVFSNSIGGFFASATNWNVNAVTNTSVNGIVAGSTLNSRLDVTITNIAETVGNVVTLTCAGSTIVQNDYIYLSGLSVGTWLNGKVVKASAGTGATAIVFTDPTSHGTQASTAETGTAHSAWVTYAKTTGNITLTTDTGTLVQQATGSYTALQVAVTETALGGSANYLLNLLAGAAGTTQKFAVTNTGNVLMISGSELSWNADSGISRLGAASLAVGNGTAGDYSGSLKLTTLQMAASSGAPTSAGTAGTAGEIIYYSGVLYFCSVTGTAGHATWNILNMTVN